MGPGHGLWMIMEHLGWNPALVSKLNRSCSTLPWVCHDREVFWLALSIRCQMISHEQESIVRDVDSKWIAVCTWELWLVITCLMQYPCIWSNLNQRTYSDVESWQPMQLYKDWVGMLHPYMYPSCHHKAWTSAFFDLHPVCFFNRGDGRYLRRCWDVRHFTDSNCFRSFSFMLCCNWEDKTEMRKIDS